MSIALTHTGSVRTSTTDASAYGSGSTASGSGVEVGSVLFTHDLQYGAGITDAPVACSVVAANVQGFLVISDKDVTIKTNSAGSPAQTWNFKAGRPIWWGANDGGIFANPVTTNITGLFVSTSLPARLRMFILTA